MKYENFRQALRYLLHIVKYNPEARTHPAILRLPEAVREERVLLAIADRLVLELLLEHEKLDVGWMDWGWQVHFVIRAHLKATT